MALTQITTNGIKDGTITGTDLTTNVDLVDNQKLRLGTGDDLQIFHDGNNSYILNSGGNLILKNSSVNYIQGVTSNGAVELNYNGSKKFETTSAGVDITGQMGSDTIHIPDGTTGIQVGNSNDLKIFHDGTNSSIQNGTGTLRLRGDSIKLNNNAASENYLVATANGAVELYYDNTVRFQTTAGGVLASGALESTGLIYSNNNDIKTGGDTGKLMVGAGNDLQIYHNGTDSHLDNTTGELALRSDTIRLRGKTGNETLAVFEENGAAKLYYDNSKKLETTTGGAEVTGNFGINSGSIFINTDSQKLYVGAGQDLQIYHDGNNSRIENSTGQLKLKAATAGTSVQMLGASDEMMVQAIGNGAVELYYDNGKKFETTSAGVKLLGSGTDAIEMTGDVWFNNNEHAGADIYFNSGSKHLIFEDNVIAKFGGGGDLQIYHDGSHSRISDEGSGNLTIQSNGGNIQLNKGTSENMLVANTDGSVELYYDASKKFETISGGISVTGGINTSAASTFNQSSFNSGAGAITIAANSDIRFTNGAWTGNAVKIQHHDNVLYVGIGSNGIIFREDGTGRWKIDGSGHFTPEANNTYDIGSTSQRIRNIYTNDLNLSNEGGANDVDGTWGSYTIQEGAEDLFLVNKRSGKKYKFALTEVS